MVQAPALVQPVLSVRVGSPISQAAGVVAVVVVLGERAAARGGRRDHIGVAEIVVAGRSGGLAQRLPHAGAHRAFLLGPR